MPLATSPSTEDTTAQTVNLAGIGMGAGDTGQTLTVTATSSNTAIIPTPTITYTSANTGGSIAFTPVANTFGTVTITVKVLIQASPPSAAPTP